MPDEYLDGLEPGERAAMWRRHIQNGRADGLLVAVADDNVVGFAAFDRCLDLPTDEEGRAVGQLYAINLHPDAWGRGIGRQLLRAASDRLFENGMGRMVLWVVPENGRARSLYGSEGWIGEEIEGVETVLGAVVTEMRYSRT